MLHRKLTEVTDQKHRSNSMRCLIISMLLDPACTLHPSYCICLSEARTEASSTVNTLTRKSSFLFLEGEVTTHLLPFINAIICLVFLHDGTHAHNETGMFWCPLHSFDCKNLWQLKIYGWCTVRICIARNSWKRHSTRTIRLLKKLGTPDLFNVVLLADVQGKDKGWSVFISSYNRKFLQSFKNQGHH